MLSLSVTAITSNPLETRRDLVVLLLNLATPLLVAQSSSGARICLSGAAAGFDQAAAELEGYARVLWGLAPLLAVEPDHPQFRLFRLRWVEGLEAGTDRTHPDYWGEVTDKDQRFVEMGAIVSVVACQKLSLGLCNTLSAKGILDTVKFVDTDKRDALAVNHQRSHASRQ